MFSRITKMFSRALARDPLTQESQNAHLHGDYSQYATDSSAEPLAATKEMPVNEATN